MPPALKPAAPSQSLLRFLRAQSEGFAFSGLSHGATCVVRRCPNAASSRRNVSTGASSTPRVLVRYLGTSSSPRRPVLAVMRSGLLDLDAIVPRSLCRKQRTMATSLNNTPEQPPTPDAPPDCMPDKMPYKPNRPTWRDWIFRREDAAHAASQLKEEDLRILGDQAGSIFPRRPMTAKAALDPRLRCTEVDGSGNVIMVDGELKKSELIAKYGLLPRDLRKIDSSNLPHIVVRPSAILLNLLHLKVLIKHDRVLLFDVYGSRTSFSQSAFMYDLQGKLQQKQMPGANNLPYEFRALEAVLTSVTTELEAEFGTVRDPILLVLSELEDVIDREKLRSLLYLSKRVSTFEQKAKLVRDAIEELLEADDDLAAMYLTEKTHDLFRGEDDHTEIELLLESYNKICDEVVQEASNLVSSIRNTEEIIRAILDANRNSLMLLDLKFSVGTLGLAMGTFLAGLYGMNVENFIEETNWGFGTVTAVSTFFSIIVCWYGLIKLRKVQRVRMRVDKHHSGDRSQFFQEDPNALLDPTNRERLRRINMMKTVKQRPKRWF
ncbi:mitochondrial inner membrane magnesium transporter mrs2 [Lasiosphaeria miniovina]|uniref:Magnesium transporter n=1 Tax=Lasiosphaeria miniovina TaxID=1954250 RepID=A0AA40AJN4_9PEZI|nr:mitochondrial inner membrane magnesium transporter mrs2 [Lasiosphaeria miniovina]KAK0717106.1 mitochondrial inner membrane magnesium transporter mrs2 [Lasiosphaeria miniovina]